MSAKTAAYKQVGYSKIGIDMEHLGRKHLNQKFNTELKCICVTFSDESNMDLI